MEKKKARKKRARKKPARRRRSMPRLEPMLAREAGLTCGVCGAPAEFYDTSQPDYRQRERCAAHNANSRSIKYATTKEGMLFGRAPKQVQGQVEAAAPPGQ
jgi:hypothetical protein